MVSSCITTWWLTLPHDNGPPGLPYHNTWMTCLRRIAATALPLYTIPWYRLITMRCFLSPYLVLVMFTTTTMVAEVVSSKTTTFSKNGRHRHTLCMSSPPPPKNGGGRRGPLFAAKEGRLLGPSPICTSTNPAVNTRPSISGDHFMCIVQMIPS